MSFIQRFHCYCEHIQGMVEAGDTVSATLKKEFGEEAMNSLEATEEEKRKIEQCITDLFHNGEEVRSTTGRWWRVTCALTRSMLATWTTLVTPTTPGWRQWPRTSMTKQVHNTQQVSSQPWSVERPYLWTYY